MAEIVKLKNEESHNKHKYTNNFKENGYTNSFKEDGWEKIHCARINHKKIGVIKIRQSRLLRQRNINRSKKHFIMIREREKSVSVRNNNYGYAPSSRTFKMHSKN